MDRAGLVLVVSDGGQTVDRVFHKWTELYAGSKPEAFALAKSQDPHLIVIVDQAWAGPGAMLDLRQAAPMSSIALLSAKYDPRMGSFYARALDIYQRHNGDSAAWRLDPTFEAAIRVSRCRRVEFAYRVRPTYLLDPTIH